MSTDRDTTRLVRSWLEEGVTALPDRVLDAVLDQIPATPQRRSWWPSRRFAQMNNYARIVIGAVAAVAVLLVAINLLPRQGGVGGKPSMSPTTTPTAQPTATPVPTTAPEITTGRLAPGTYTVSSLTSTPFTVNLPAGWSLDQDAFIAKGDFRRATGVAFGTWVVTHVYPESCTAPRNMKPVATTAELLTALGAQTGHENSGPAEATIGGIRVTRFVFSVPGSFDLATCDGGIVRLWPGTGGDDNSGEPILVAGQTSTVYVIPEATKTTTLVAIQHDGSTPGDIAELQAILDSIEFQD